MKSNFLNLGILAAILILWSCPSRAQPPRPTQPAPSLEMGPIRIGTSLVTLNVGVYDKKGNQIDTLKQENFNLVEDGRPQEIAFFGRVDQPISFGLLIDRSQSMGDTGKLANAKAVLQEFLHVGNTQNEAFCLAFNETSGLLTDFTSNYTDLAAKLDKLWAEGGTALYDAIRVGLEHLERGKHQRRVLIIVTDGGDQHSHMKLTDLLKHVQQSDAQIYAIGFFSPFEDDIYRHSGIKVELVDNQTVDNPRFVFKTLAEETGAETFFPRSAEELEKTIAAIAASLRRQYTLAYYPNTQRTDDGYRQITVTLTGKESRQMQVRTRQGYRPSQPLRTETVSTDSGEKKTGSSAASPSLPSPPRILPENQSAPSVYQQTFDDPVAGWPQTDKAFARKGKYYLRGQQIAPAPPFEYADFEATATIFFPAGAADEAQINAGRPGAVTNAGSLPTAGFSFRINERGYYTIAIAPARDRQGGLFSLAKVADGEKRELIGWRKDSAIIQRNEVKLRCRGAQIEVFINQLRVAVVDDDGHQKGRFGLVTGDNEAVFDDLTIKKLDKN